MITDLKLNIPNTICCNTKSEGLYQLHQLRTIVINSLTTEKQTTKFSSANFQKMLSPCYSILRIQRLEGKRVDLDEVAHYEPPHQDLRCLQIQLFSSLVVKELRSIHLETTYGATSQKPNSTVISVLKR